MKHTRRIASLLLALVMVFAMATTAMAADGKGTITISNAVSGETYGYVKLFDAVPGSEGNIVYTGTIPTALGDYFQADANGYITATDTAKKTDADGNVLNEFTDAAVAAITTWAKAQTIPDANKTTATSTSVAFENLDYGYYVITSSLGAIVTIDSTNPNATVTEKNTAPELDKSITGANSIDEDGKKALAQVGTDVEFTVPITIGKGNLGYVFHDVMESSLSYNNDVKVYTDADCKQEVLSTNYDTATATGETITVSFKDDFIKTLAAGSKLYVRYTAKVTSDALQMDSANNTAKLQYGEATNIHYTPEKTTEVWNAKFTVTKQDGNGAALAGAGFVIAKTEGEGENAKTLYYKIENNVVSWVESIDNATENISDAQGNVASFTGLANGTYTLIEKTVPAGYNKAADQTFTIAEHDYSNTNTNEKNANLIQATTVVNQSGSELPSTGGMGTTLFYVVGGLMVLAAVVLLVTKKRMASAE